MTLSTVLGSLTPGLLVLGVLVRRLLVLSVIVGLIAPAAPAQASLRVNVLRSLAFDRLAPGMPSLSRGSVPTDTGVFEVLGPPGTPIELWFTLPAAFDGPSGATLPLTFDPSSASFSAAQSTADRIPFDPRLRQQFRIPPSGRMLVFLTGRVLVGADQKPGNYRASIVLFANQVN
ncbi:MAG: hypothetical protein ACKVS7_04830 [Gemmatimonadaceae bacterium]